MEKAPTDIRSLSRRAAFLAERVLKVVNTTCIVGFNKAERGHKKSLGEFRRLLTFIAIFILNVGVNVVDSVDWRGPEGK